MLTSLQKGEVRSYRTPPVEHLLFDNLCTQPAAQTEQSLGRGSPGGTGAATIVDALVVTVAPTIVGEAGVGYSSGLHPDKVRMQLDVAIRR